MTQTKNKKNIDDQNVKETEERGITLVASGKGGVGKTWLSITLAHQLAQKGKKVLLFDGDLGLANVDIQLGLTPTKDIGDVVDGTVKLEDIILRYAPGHFDVIAGRSGCGSLASIAPERLSLIREELKKISHKYDHVLIDLGAGIGGIVKALSPITNHCLLILTDEPTSITDGYAFMKVTLKSLPTMKMDLVINQAESLTQGQSTYTAFKKVCEKFLNYAPNLACVIRRDNQVKQAIRSQTSLIEYQPKADAATDIQYLSEFMNHRA